MQVTDQYPGDAIGGADFITLASHGEITEQWPDGPRVRREKVIVTDVYRDFEGRVCIGERTARHFAHLFNMVDSWRVAGFLHEYQAVADERDLLSRELAEARRQVANLMEMERSGAATVFVDLAGVEHASKAAAVDASRRHRKQPRAAVEVLQPVSEAEIDGAEATT